MFGINQIQEGHLNCSKPINGYNSINFTYIDPKVSVVVDEGHS